MSGEPAEGGCLCGAVRYRVTGDPVAATLCHCRSCRRASGGTNVAWAVFEIGGRSRSGGPASSGNAFEWLADQPVAYSSSRGIEWLHCHGCGSLVGYRRSSRPDHIDITTGTLDEPDRFPPAVEIWLEQKIGWETLHPDLTKRPRSSLNE